MLATISASGWERDLDLFFQLPQVLAGRIQLADQPPQLPTHRLLHLRGLAQLLLPQQLAETRGVDAAPATGSFQ
jgi:hypothetical protein